MSNNTLSRAELDTTGTIKNIHYGDVLIKFGDTLNIQNDDIPYIKDNSKIRNPKYLANGDVIIADTAEDETVGKSTEIYGITDEKVVSGLHTIPVRPLQKFASKYLGYYINSPAYHNQLLAIMQGIKVYSISKSNIANTIIKFPNIQTQSKIAELLFVLDRRIEKQHRLIDSIKSYKRGLFLHLYNGIAKIKIKFKDIYIQASEGGTPATANVDFYQNGTIPFVKIEDLSKHYLTATKSSITEKGLRHSSAWVVPTNSIIFSNGATIGACSINKIPVTTKQGILGIVPKETYISNYLYHFFTSSIFMKKIKAITTKGTMDCAYLKDIDNLIIEIPSYEKQTRIATILDNYEKMIELCDHELRLLQQSKSALLQRLFI